MKIKFKKRVVWRFNPCSRVVPSKKRYKRSKAKDEIKRSLQYFD